MGSVLDLGPVNVRGVISARQARIVWADGTLYVLSRSQSGVTRQTVATSQPVEPSVPSGYWRAETTDGGFVSWTRKGCSSCGGRYPTLARFSRQEIIDGDV